MTLPPLLSGGEPILVQIGYGATLALIAATPWLLRRRRPTRKGSAKRAPKRNKSSS